MRTVRAVITLAAYSAAGTARVPVTTSLPEVPDRLRRRIPPPASAGGEAHPLGFHPPGVERVGHQSRQPDALGPICRGETEGTDNERLTLMDTYELQTRERDLKEREEALQIGRFCIKVTVGVIVGFLALFWTWKLITPRYNLYRANVEKEILVREARAKGDAAVELSRAEVNRAKGVAESNTIIAASIDEQYLRYLYIQALEGNTNQIIYVPTEAGLPILEAGRGQG
jgi:hypothetical protein